MDYILVAGIGNDADDFGADSCIEAGGDPANLVVRERSGDLSEGRGLSPEIFIGRIGSGNTVMKSREDRDRIATRHDLIAYEIEGAGA
jgi:hypothetical protein